MKTFLTEWKKYINETSAPYDFDKEQEKLDKKYDTFYSNLKKVDSMFQRFEHYTPEGSEILTQIELGKEIGAGFYGRVFEIVGSTMVIKFFRGGVGGVDFDIERMKKIIEKVFAGTAGSKGMHYFDIGKIQNNVNYVIMPRITSFERSITFKQNPEVFLAVSEALHEAAKDLQESDTYADFREAFYRNMAKDMHSKIKYKFNSRQKAEQKEFEEEFLSSLNDYDETIHKILRIAYATFKEEGGTDLHLGNLGFFPQKPDDWFFFDM
jgi:hypothetical protein